MNIPIARVPTTEMIVNAIPLLPDASDSYRFIPKPRPTTEYCRSIFDIFLLNAGKPWPKISAYASPINNITGGVHQQEII